MNFEFQIQKHLVYGGFSGKKIFEYTNKYFCLIYQTLNTLKMI